MVICPNCDHSNPEGAVQCEACYTPLPASTPKSAGSCPQCGAAVQEDAMFCGQCGFNLSTAPAATPAAPPTPIAPPSPPVAPPPSWEEELEEELSTDDEDNSETEVTLQMVTPPAATPKKSVSTSTKIQTPQISLLHVQTNIPLEVPANLEIVHIGKPNNVVPPDIDVSGFPHSEVVSRVHADLRLENVFFYIEDTGSSNGTYINHVVLPAGNRHRLRSGDRIALGKGDKVTFIFHIAES